MGMCACSLLFHCLYKAIYKYKFNQLRNFLCKDENLINLNKQNIWVADNAGGIWWQVFSNKWPAEFVFVKIKMLWYNKLTFQVQRSDGLLSYICTHLTDPMHRRFFCLQSFKFVEQSPLDCTHRSVLYFAIVKGHWHTDK